MPTYAAVEGGGTTFVVCIAEERRGAPLRILDRAEFPTLVPPSETLSQVTAWLRGRECAMHMAVVRPLTAETRLVERSEVVATSSSRKEAALLRRVRPLDGHVGRGRDYDALGVAMFGPVDLDPASPTWGYVTTTPKPGWQNTDVMGPLLAVRRVPCCFDTDVNAPALEEFRHFARPGETSCAYVTVGTGIGVGLVVNGRCVRGLVHPEGGHIAVKKRRPDDSYKGIHPWCVEGQCSAVALAERAGVPQEALKDLPEDHPVWDDAAYLLGSLCATLCALLSVERIVLSGGVMLRASLFPKVRRATREILDGYIAHPRVLTDGPEGIDGYIVPSVRGNDAGLYGAIALAAEAARGNGLGTKGAASTASTSEGSPSPLSAAPAPAAGGALAAALGGAVLGAAAMAAALRMARRSS